MDCVFEIVHVFLISCDIENAGDWLRQFDWELAGVRTQLDWRVETARIAGVVVLVSLVQAEEHGCLVVLHHMDADVDVGLVTIVDPPDGVVTVQLPGMHMEL